MKNNYIKHTFFLIVIMISLSSCLSKKRQDKQQFKVSEKHNFTNRSEVPLIKYCINNQTKACLQNSISRLILSAANTKNLILKKDTLRIGIRINTDGSTSIMENESQNSPLKTISLDVLSSLEVIEPAYFENQKSYKTVSYFWDIFFEKNNITNNFDN